MKKIGIITCIKSNDVCTRAGCLKAFHERRNIKVVRGTHNESYLL